MTFKPQTLASVRSYYFRELLIERPLHITGRYETLADFRPYWEEANVKAKEMLRRMSNRYNHQTRTWEQGA